MTQSSLFHLADLAESLLDRAYVPYSHRPAAACLLLSDGSWIPGVRVENASFSLTIPAVMNAVSTAVALGRRDWVAVATAGRPQPDPPQYLVTLDEADWPVAAPGVFTRPGTDLPPDAAGALPPFEELHARVPASLARKARAVAERAFIPESAFPVGCLIRAGAGRWVPGVNVEHPDWSSILCAERNALGTVVSYGLGSVDRVVVSCPRDPLGTPCGACRQVLVELAPGCPVVMDRGRESPEVATTEALLPGAFSGLGLRS